jgi:hypothetical protein
MLACWKGRQEAVQMLLNYNASMLSFDKHK